MDGVVGSESDSSTHEDRMKIAIVGCGGVGGYFGGKLAATGELEVHFLVREGSATETALRRRGLRVTATMGSFSVKPCRVSTSAAAIGLCDAVIVCVKGKDLAALDLKPLLRQAKDGAAATAIVPLLNGIEAPNHFQRAVVVTWVPRRNLPRSPLCMQSGYIACGGGGVMRIRVY